MDGNFTLMLHVRAGKTSVERKPKVEGDGLGSRNSAVGETGREDAEKPCWFSSFTARQRRQQSSGTLQTNRREEELEEDKRGSKGLIEEEKARTRQMLRPCRMHKARTRRETSK